MKPPSPTLPRVCAVVVTYFPSRDVLDNIAALRSEVDRVFVIDNGSSGASLEYLREVERTLQCRIKFNGTNLGIAAAMNQGVDLAIGDGYPWVITFDQDSTVTPGFVSAMWAEYNSREYKDTIGVLSPCYVDRSSGNTMDAIASNYDIKTSMTSGSMMPTKVFEECGGFNEALFMDYVDHEFCLRLGDCGYRVVRCPGAVLLHSLGRLRYYDFFGHTVTCTHHSAMRRYYITRNRVWLYQKYWHSNRRWILADARACFKELVKMLLLEDDRWKKAGHTLLGVRDGLTGRMGELPHAARLKTSE